MSDTQINLFPISFVKKTSEELTAEAEAAVYTLLADAVPLCIAFSGGKDSSVVLNIALTMSKRAAAAGLKPFVAITTASTGVENPEVQMHMSQELNKAREYGSRNGFQVVTRIASPMLSQSYQLKTLTGRGLPPYAHLQRADCSTDWKVNPQTKVRKQLFKSLSAKGMKEPVTLLGTRFGESEKRDISMKVRGDRHDTPRRNADGDLVMCPIAYFDTDSVWGYLGLASSGVIDSYSDFKETLRIYAAAAGTSCVVVADAIYEGGSKQRVGKCGARTGCWVCVQAVDKSLAAMVEFEERYAYAKPLVKFNQYLRNIAHDLSRRHWIGRTIRAGYVVLAPDTFHPTELRAQTRYLLQMDFDERNRAAREGGPVMFQNMDLRTMIAVDAMQSLYGVAKPFSCWADLRDIESGRIRYDIPDVQEHPKGEMPAPRFLYVGEAWDSSSDNQTWDGLRNPLMEALTQDSPCERKLTELKSGHLAWELETEASFDVDGESAELIYEFERDRLVEMHDRGFGVGVGSGPSAYLFYLSYGVLTLSHRQQAEHDMFARRTAFKDRLGLGIEYSIDDLLAKSVSFSELPQHAVRAWSGKSTTESAQTSMLAELDESVALAA